MNFIGKFSDKKIAEKDISVYVLLEKEDDKFKLYLNNKEISFNENVKSKLSYVYTNLIEEDIQIKTAIFSLKNFYDNPNDKLSYNLEKSNVFLYKAIIPKGSIYYENKNKSNDFFEDNHFYLIASSDIIVKNNYIKTN